MGGCYEFDSLSSHDSKFEVSCAVLKNSYFRHCRKYMLYHSRSMISLLLHESEAEPRTSVNNKDIILLL